MGTSMARIARVQPVRVCTPAPVDIETAVLLLRKRRAVSADAWRWHGPDSGYRY